jgi:hypothetical protein
MKMTFLQKLQWLEDTTDFARRLQAVRPLREVPAANAKADVEKKTLG